MGIVTNPVELPYKIYSALLTQTLGNVLVPIILQNTIGNIVWSVNSVGDYSATLTGAFTNNKTFVITSPEGDIDDYYIFATSPYGDVNSINFSFRNSSRTLKDINDTELLFIHVEIRVYP